MLTKRMSHRVFLMLLASAFVLGAGPAEAAPYYQIDFGTPPHTVGLPPATGGGALPRATVSSIQFGTPTVVAGLGLLDDQPLKLDSSDGEGDQIQLDLADLPPANTYDFRCQVLVQSPAQAGGYFNVLFDTPTVRTVTFYPDGAVRIFVPGLSGARIGTYLLDRVINLRVYIDLAYDTWRIYLDDSPVYTGPFGGATQLVAVRLTSATGSPAPAVVVGLDNIVLADSAFPDLQVASLSAPDSVAPGDPIGDQVGLIIRNASSVDVAAAFSVGFYISPDDVITAEDQLLTGGREFVPSIPAGGSLSVPLAYPATIPEGYPPGPAFFGVMIDEFNAVLESDETNNTTSRPIFVVALASVKSPVSSCPEPKLFEPVPNPGDRRMTVEYELPIGGPVKLAIFDAQGRQVSRLLQVLQPPGRHWVSVSELISPEMRIARGAYFVNIRFGGNTLTRRVVLLE